ncbi:ATP-binding protein [Streptomyces sp. CB01881]|uniref:ATP-binding protein n=1 Tax=Streptomyces sp. CB01881 TaxID=2078691 RepID=UPI000CDBAE3E|nr:ATP-binding protein [Streptomyces sp. CB01881]AUY49807.1 AAA family ATPase [Streptomyces sp. CB01881]TYC73199.1 ATP-binding protein [Streptomyces sp. CB01881]
MGQPSGEFRQEAVRTRGGELVSGALLVTVGTPDGSEVRPCPEEWRPRPRRIERTEPARGPVGGPGRAVGPLALGAGPADLPLLDREADIAQLLGLLAEGRSIRLVGQAGSGRSALLSAVAEAAGDLAPGGVVQLCGHRRTAADLLQDLFAATHQAPGFRPDPGQLAEHLGRVGAIVVIDEVEPAGPGLEDLLAAAPDCAFLISVAPDSPPLPADSRLRDHLVAGLSRPASLALAARLAGRPLDAAEKAWAVDLWFESEGLPLRFVQAAALLRQRDVAVDALVAAEEDRLGVFGAVEEPSHDPDPAVREAELRGTVPLPSVAESASPAVRLAEGLSEPAQAVLRLAVALGGECPTAPHLPALIDVGQGESALHELADAGLAVSIGGHHRLTAGALDLLAPQWPARGSIDGAAQHFAWWVGHSSVSTEQIAAEAEVVLGVLLADRTAGRHASVVRLARAAAPALALALRWGAWERALLLGLEAARQTGSRADEAWFHHELGVYAICVQQSGRAIAELESALTLRAALGEPRGAAGARRMLDLLRADGRQLPAAAAGPVPVRRPVIRAIAQVPWRFRTTPGTGPNRRTVVAASAAVLALGVLGTAVAMSVAGPDEHRSTDPHSRPDDGAGVPAGLPTPRPSLSPSATATGGTESPDSSPEASGTAPEPSSSSSGASHSPSASKKPSKSPSAGESASQPPAQNPSQPPAGGAGGNPPPPPQHTEQPPPPVTTPAPSPTTSATQSQAPTSAPPSTTPSGSVSPTAPPSTP